ncbi:Hemolysin, chromosomal [Devosia equisanguinis]|uniref:Hemolysin, chromosomal n=1 Tax=Devosia equisanguinis TaxID=2490941 RepID=A0A447IFH5_9HYPH|nr:cadherin-like domain-containing protein [Devosia equisanguinis]VDS06206.1 Hemolysin, chromosomal [Devosia equisanguinis]
MSASLEGIQVKISLELQGWFETTVPITVNSVTVGSGIELNQYFSSRILSDTDGNGTIEPVQGPNGLLDGWLKVDISGNQVFAQFSGQAQPTGIKIKIENLAPTGAAPGTVEMAGQMNGVNTVYAPTYTASTKVLELNWFLLGFQPGTVINQTVFYDNMLDDAPVAVDDSFAINVGQTLSGANILANDTDLDNLGNFGIVDISTVTKINGVNLNPNQWIDLQGGGQIKVSSSGQLQFREDGDFTDLARGVTRTTSFQYTIADSTGLTDVGTASIAVTGVNSAPTINLPSAPSILENSSVALSGISIADVDGDAQTVTLNVNHGALALSTTAGLSFSDPNGFDGTLSFSGSLANINAALASLSFAPTANYTGPVTLSVSTGDGSATKTAQLSLSVADVKPVLPSIQASINENATAGTPVVTLVAFGDNNGLTYSIISGNESGAFAINAATGAITVADSSKLDFEHNAAFSLLVGVDDEDGDTIVDATGTVTITLNDVNEKPTNLALSALSTNQSSSGANATVATLLTTDPDSGDTFTYELVAGAGDGQNGRFTIVGNELRAVSALEAGTYNVRLKTIDADGLFLEKAFTVTVGDDVKPVITSISAPDAPLGIGSTLLVTINAGEAGLSLQAGSVNGQALTSFTDLGGGIYTAIYTVAEGHPSIAANQDIPVSIQLRDAAGNVSDAYTTALANTDDLIDSVRPTGSAPTLAAASDTGLSSADGITASTALTFTGTGEDGATVKLFDANHLALGTGTVVGGSWSITTVTMAEGNHTVHAEYFDAVDNSFVSQTSTVTIDTTPPTAVADTASLDLRNGVAVLLNVLSNDTGAIAVQAVGGHAVAVGNAVAGSNGGSFVLQADGTLSFDPQTAFVGLASGDTALTSVDFTITDSAGNTSTSSASVTVTGRNDAPTLTVNAGASVTAGATLTITAAMLTAADADDLPSGLTYTIGSLPTGGQLRLGNTVLQANDTFTQDDVNQGRLTYMAGSSAGQQQFAFSLADGGEDNSLAIHGQTFAMTVTAAPVTPTQPTQTTETETIGGVTVTTSTTTQPDGSKTHVVTIPVISGSTTTPVKIPLVTGSNGGTVLSVDVPPGVGLTVSGTVTPTTSTSSTTQFTAQLGSQGGTSVDPTLLAGGQQYLSNLPTGTPVIVQTIVPTVAPGVDALSSPIIISGAVGNGSTQTMLIVDTKGLPPGAVLQFDNVSFAVVVGNATITGGAGSQTVFADGGSQYIVLGADDDELHGGAGDDTIGSVGGNDRLFGDDGNDTLFGGPGDDFLSGGAGYDKALYEGTFETVQIHRNSLGQLVVSGPEGTDTLDSIEHIVFQNGTVSYTTIDLSGDQGTLYKLYQTIFGRPADQGGLDYWVSKLAGNTSLVDITRSFLASDEFGRLPGPDGGTNEQFLVALYEQAFHRAPDTDGMNYWLAELGRGVHREDIVLSFAASDETSALIGDTPEQPLWYL